MTLKIISSLIIEKLSLTHNIFIFFAEGEVKAIPDSLYLLLREKGGEYLRIMTNSEFQEIIHSYEKLVFTICFQMVRDYHDAQNLTQETFLSAFIHIDNCRLNELKPWLARIASNKAKDFLKSAYKRRVLLNKDSESDFLDTGQSEDDIFKVTESDLALKQIYDKIGSLKEPYKEISRLYFLEEKNVDEISILLDRPKKTVQTQIYRARLILQAILKGDA